MSIAGGSPIDTSLLQTAQAQQTASKARDREVRISDRTRRYIDQLELRVAAMESAEAIRQMPQNDSEQAEQEHEAKGGPSRRKDDDETQHIDVRV